jgi:L-lactate dehydrogenase complex protein LldF
VHIDFRANTQRVPLNMPPSIQSATTHILGNRAAVVEVFGKGRWEALRQAGHDVRSRGIEHLGHSLVLLEEQVTKAGGHVHWAQNADEARRIVLQIAQQHQVKRAVKAKSMATEEIGLNQALQDAGIDVLETDLGEYIVQLAGVGPSHIITPAVHLRKEVIAELFREKLGVEAPPDPAVLTEIARARLRAEFLSADMGISGGNFLVAETGTLVMVTNEGNGRMCTTLPPLLVSVVGIDKVVPDWESLAVLLQLLARSATGQKITTYTTLIRGASSPGNGGGPREFHLVLLDNGRSRILQDEAARSSLLCIRCGACLNVCPVYNHVGGYAYGWVYSGPIGAILSTQLLGTEVAGSLPYASTLCGACNDICPVKVPLTEILLHLRRRVVEGDEIGASVVPPALTTGVKAGTLAFGMPRLYELGSQLLRLVQVPWRQDGWLPALPPPLDRWTLARPLPTFSADFREWWRNRTPEGRRRNLQRRIGAGALAAGAILAWLWTRRRAGR